MMNLILNEERYENDIRALLMAFYHGEKIFVQKKQLNGDTTDHSIKPMDENEKDGMTLEVLYEGEGMHLSCMMWMVIFLQKNR